jgi:hypothetical protein
LYEFAGDIITRDLYALLCETYLKEGKTKEEKIEQYAILYDMMFRLTMRMNRLCPIYDDGFIAHIAREALSLGEEIWSGVSERELMETLSHRLRHCAKTEKPGVSGYAVDCHVHTSDGSGCANHSAEQMAEAAIANNLDAIIITEHNKLTPQRRIDELNEKYAPFRLFSGIEIRIDGDDFLVLGLHDETLEQKMWNYPDLHRFVRQRGGYIALAHALRYWNGVDSNIFSFKPDALELYSVNIDNLSWHTRQNELKLANALQVKYIANSDAHSTDSYRYCNILEKAPQDETELIKLLKNGSYRLGKVPV